MPRTKHIHITRSYLLLCAIVVNDVHLPGDYIPRVLHLAARCLRKRLYGLRPLPPGSNVTRPAVNSSMFAISNLPWSKVRVSSGESRLFALTFSDAAIMVAPFFGFSQ